MGFSHSTYHFYGVHVPREKYQTDHQHCECDFIDATINHNPELKGKGLGHITAGDYDRDELFLCLVPDNVDCEVELGTFRVVSRDQYPDLTAWNYQLRLLANALGYEGLDAPGWCVVPDLS